MATLVCKVPVLLEIKRENRFIVEFPKEFDIESWLVRSISRPHFKNNKWENIEMTFMDPIGPSTSERLFKLINKYKKKGLFSFLKKDIFTFQIQSLDPVGQVVETWSVDVKELVSVDFGKYDYGVKDEDSLQIIKMILKPSNCTLID